MSLLPALPRARQKSLVVLLLPLVLLGSLLTAAPASALGASLTITPIEWNVVGLDSNNVAVGPNQYSVGARVCNITGVAVTDISVAWGWTTTNAFISIDGSDSKTIASLAANTCQRLWWTVEVVRDAAAKTTKRGFQITASAATESSVSTPANREIYVESLVSQNRNSTDSLTGPTAVTVGSTVTYVLTGKTATNGYEQLSAGPTLDGSIFEIQSVAATYNVPTGATNTGFYADACGWNPGVGTANYLACVGPAGFTGGKAGGLPITVTVTAYVKATGSGKITGNIYDYSGSSFHYNSDIQIINVVSTAPQPPIAVDDSASTTSGVGVLINVPSNDTDADGDLALTSVTITAAASRGTTAVNATTGVVTYTPTSSTYVGTDTFTYQICDAGNRCDTAVVTVTIVGPPDAINDSATVVIGSNVAINVPANDTDPDGDLALTSVTITAAASRGTTAVNATTGVVTYTPTSPTYVGTDTFTYRICDSGNRCDTATVTVTIVAGPAAVNDSAAVVVGGSVAINVPANDSDPDGDLALTSVTITGAASHGTTSVNATTGVVTYTPTSPTYVGTDTFTYQICDSGSRCTTALVTVTIVAPPVANDDSATVVTGSFVVIPVPTNDTDLDGDLALTSVTITAAASHGSTSVNATTGVVTYTPTNSTYVGTDTFTYRICDSGSRCDTAVVTVTIVAPPVANDDTATVVTGSSVIIAVPSNDTDLDGDLALTSVTISAAPTRGTTSINPTTGVITYTPTSPSYVGTDLFQYQICDSGGRCDIALVTVTIVAPPVANDDSASVVVGSSVAINVPSNDTDLDGDLALTSVTITAAASHGSTSVNATTGVVTYTPTSPTYVGTDTFTYQICDAGNRCDTAVVTVTIAAPPVAVNNSAATLTGVAVLVDVPANDTDLDGDLDLTSVSIVTGPSNGSTSVDPVTGKITYTSGPGFVGTVTFTYEICDLGGRCDSAVVTITVTAPPVAVDDAKSTLINTSVDINVVTNDSDLDNDLDLNTISVITSPVNGTITSLVGGVFTYQPDSGYSGTDTFVYEICDTGNRCDTATVTITITALTVPVAIDDSAAGFANTDLVIDVPANDTDPDNNLDTTTVSIVTGPVSGSFSINPVTGKFTYSPYLDFVGTDTFEYEICDDDAQCDIALVTVTITAPPVAVDELGNTLTGVPVLIDVPANDTDLDGDLDPTSVSIVSGPSNGTVTVNPVTGVIEYSSTVGFVGTNTFTYRICDLAGNCDEADVTITVVAPPVANDESATVVVGSNVAINVPSNDTDGDGDLALTSVTITGAASHGTTSVNPVTGVVTYTPTSPTYVGTDTFTYQICDSGSRCDTALVTVTIVAPPVANDESATVVVGSNVAINVPGNDTDLDGDLAVTSVSITGAATHGTTSVNPVTGVVTYTPTSPTYVGTDTFTYQICDSGSRCDTALVTVTIVAPPVAVDNPASTLTGVPVTVDVPANDTDLDGDLDVTDVSLVSGPSNGSVLIDGVTGEIEYTSTVGFVGIDTFSYRICDLGNRCDTALVAITVTAPPVAVDNTGSTLSGVPVTVDVPADDTDLDGDLDITSVALVTGPTSGGVSINALTGAITYTSNLGFVGVDTFTYRICDLGGNCDQAVVTITVAAPPAPPIAGDDSVVATTAVPVLINVPLNDSDVDGDLDVTSVNVTSGPSNGSTSVNALTGKITYTSDPGFTGVDTFTYKICDSQPVCDTALVTVTVGAVPPVPSPPVANDDSATATSGVPVLINVPINDTDVDGDLDPTSVRVTVAPNNGSTSVNSVTGRVTYTPNVSFVGTDTFTYRICDTQPVCDTAVVTITVTAPIIPPAPPVATNNSVKTKFGTPVSINVLDNDSDPDGDLDPSSVRVVVSPPNGTVSTNPVTFELIYTPDPSFYGLDTLSYEVCDLQFPTPACTAANVTIEIPPLTTLAFTGVEPEVPLLVSFAALLLGGLALGFGARRKRESTD